MPLDSAILAKMKASKNKYSRGGNTIKLKEGKTTIRLLQKGSEQFWKEIGVFWIKTEKEGKPIAVVGDSDEIYGKPSMVAAAIDKAMASATDEEKSILKDMRSKKSVLVAALIRSGSDASEKAQLLELTGTTWSKVLGTVEEYAAEGIDAMDPKNGIDFVIERTGKGLNTEYNVMVAPKSKPVPDGVLGELPNFDEYIERELFKPDAERKALTAIGNFAGITGLTALAGPSSTAKRLTSSVVDDAVVEDTVVDTEVAEVAKALVDEPVESAEEKEERELNAKLEALAQKKAAKAAAEKAAAEKAAKAKAAADSVVTRNEPKKDAFKDEPSADDIESMLSELDD